MLFKSPHDAQMFSALSRHVIYRFGSPALVRQWGIRKIKLLPLLLRSEFEWLKWSTSLGHRLQARVL